MSVRLDAVLKQINKKYGEGTVLPANEYPKLPRFSTGIFAIDAEIGGGVPRGRIVILTGNESTGKSTVASKTVGTAQKLCRYCLTPVGPSGACTHCQSTERMRCFYVDIEGTFDPVWFTALGGNPEELLLFQPDFAEQAVDVVEAVIRTGEIDVVVIDSVAMMSPAVEIEKSAEDQIIGNHARLVNRMMRAIQSGFNSLGTHAVDKPAVILINQLREKVGVMFGNPETMPGGKGQSFASSITLKFFARASERIEESGGEKRNVGQQIRFNVEKNKTYPPHRHGIFTLYNDMSEEYGVVKGYVDNLEAMVRYGVRCGVIEKSGSWLTYVERETGVVHKYQGKAAFVTAVANAEGAEEALWADIMEVLYPHETQEEGTGNTQTQTHVT